MIVGVPRETFPGERRVALVPSVVPVLTKAGAQVVVQSAAGESAGYPNRQYEEKAAGTFKAARVLVIGAGVAGLQAIATARRLGAVVSGYDIRSAVKEQIESLGAKFVTLGVEPAGAEDKGGYAKAMDEDFYRRQREAMAKVIRENDV